MRLIDADAIKRRVVICGKEMCMKCELWKTLAEFENAPTVEAEPIRHGHWELREGFNRLQRCSACGYEYNDLIECDNYCGNCGAKMDEVTEE